MKLVIGLATRGRPALLMTTLSRTLPNITKPNTVLFASIDEDDKPTIDAINQMAKDHPVIMPHVEARPDTIAEKWNQMLTVDADVYVCMCDDGPIITPGFDQKILDAAAIVPDGIAVVTNYGENLTFPGFQAPTKRMCELMGYFFPPYFPYWFVDHWMLDITRMIGRDVFADVRLDCNANRPPTQEMREPPFWANVYDLLKHERHRVAKRILDEMDEPEWRKQMLMSHWQHWDNHSQMINDMLRRGEVGKNSFAPDERYLRLKRKIAPLLREAVSNMKKEL